MKKYTTLMMAVLSIFAIEGSAQNIEIENQKHHTSRSKKELMKMEVLKIENPPKVLNRSLLNEGFVSNLSTKEKMKTSVVKNELLLQNKINNVSASGKCVYRLKLSHLSTKEQMKTTVVGLDNCNSEAGSSLQQHTCSNGSGDVIADN